jgi:WhiB family redox-sensing transcriptional regulator
MREYTDRVFVLPTGGYDDILFSGESQEELRKEAVRKRIIALIPEWHFKASCASHRVEEFFGRSDKEGRGTITLIELRKAKRICARCDVFKTCITTALVTKEKFGVWGGTSGRTRTRILGMIDKGECTLEEVVYDYCQGNTEKYENAWGMDIDDGNEETSQQEG